MKLSLSPGWLGAALAACAPLASAQDGEGATPAPQQSLGLVVVQGSAAPTSLPTHIPSTIEGISGAEITRSINASDAEDALKYLPSLLVRKRYIGDYNHAVLSTRASGTGNSARSLVYADGILLSNLLGNGASFTPRWGLVTPDEIARVDVLYGPFSAAYAGNSVGAVVDYQTRMPQAFEAHAKLSVYRQPFDLYGTHETYGGRQASVTLGSRRGGLAWWLSLSRLDNEGQPLTFITKPVSSSAAAGTATAVSGSVAGLDKSNTPWLILGAGAQYHTVQDHAKLKLAYDLRPGLRASYTLGLWRNDSVADSSSYLRNASGGAVYSGSVAIDGKAYTLAATDFSQSREALQHRMQGFSLKQAEGGRFDWELAASRYDYARDQARTPTTAKPDADDGGAGRLTDLGGTGWSTLAAKGIWRPAGTAHQLEFGAQQERYVWQQRIDTLADWLDEGAAATPASTFGGKTQLRSLYAQDSWALAERLQALLGLRAEHWQAFDGRKSTGSFAARSESYLSPKAALGWQATQDLALRLSSGRAVRMPTVGELFQGSSSGDTVNNPGLKPEQSLTSELSANWNLQGQRLRASLFHENTRDALYSQTALVDGASVSNVQNIDRIATWGLELAAQTADWLLPGLDLQSSLTYTDSRIKANDGYVSTPGDTLGKQQPRVPRWRASLLASYAFTPALSASYGLRYAGRQYGTLNNSDANGFAYQGFSKFFSTDLRLRYLISRQWSLAAGIDNLNNYKYWNFHPYAQRSYSAELQFDL